MTGRCSWFHFDVVRLLSEDATSLVGVLGLVSLIESVPPGPVVGQNVVFSLVFCGNTGGISALRQKEDTQQLTPRSPCLLSHFSREAGYV